MLNNHLGHLNCDSITNDDILDYITKLKEINPELSNASINKHVVALKTIVKYATSERNQIHEVKRTKK